MCGIVSFTVTGALRDVWNCHCHRCRRFTGHHMAATSASASLVAIVGADNVTWYSPVPSVEYGFCRTCGSSLFWRATERSDTLSITAGSLDQPTGLATTTAWWTAEHSDYHPANERLVQHRHDG